MCGVARVVDDVQGRTGALAWYRGGSLGSSLWISHGSPVETDVPLFESSARELRFCSSLRALSVFNGIELCGAAV